MESIKWKSRIAIILLIALSTPLLADNDLPADAQGKTKITDAKNLLLEQALKEATLSKGIDRQTTFMRLAKTQVQLGDVDGAKTTVRRLGDPVSEIEVLAMVGDLAAAQAALTKLEDRTPFRDYAFLSIARAQVKTGDIAAARATSSQIKDSLLKNVVFRCIAQKHADAGDFAAAKDVAAQIEGETVKIETYANIAAMQANRGDREAAEETFGVAMNLAALMKDDEKRDRAYSRVAEAQITIGSFDAAKATATKMKNKWMKLAVYREIVRAQVKDGDIAGAQKTASQIEDTKSKESCYPEIAGAQAKKGDVASAKATAAQIGDINSKSKAYVEIAKISAERNDATVASEMVKLIKDLASQFNTPLSKAWANGEIAEVQALMGDYVAAKTTLEQIDGDEKYVAISKSMASVAVAKTQAKAGHIDDAIQTIRQFVNESRARVQAYCDIIESLTQP